MFVSDILTRSWTTTLMIGDVSLKPREMSMNREIAMIPVHSPGAQLYLSVMYEYGCIHLGALNPACFMVL
jgi:hypothetical protein